MRILQIHRVVERRAVGGGFAGDGLRVEARVRGEAQPCRQQRLRLDRGVPDPRLVGGLWVTVLLREEGGLHKRNQERKVARLKMTAGLQEFVE